MAHEQFAVELADCPIDKRLYTKHAEATKHYNFKIPMGQKGMCSYCGTYHEAHEVYCRECGNLITPRQVTKRFNPRNYYSEVAYYTLEKHNNVVMHRMFIGVTKMQHYREQIEIIEVQRDFVIDGKIRTFSKFSVSFTGRDPEWREYKYADYYYGTAAVAHRPSFTFLPKDFDPLTFYQGTAAQYTFVGHYAKQEREKQTFFDIWSPGYLFGLYEVACKYPQLEMVWRSGFKRLYKEIVTHQCDYRFVNPSAIKKHRAILKAVGDPSGVQLYAIWKLTKEKIRFDTKLIRELDYDGQGRSSDTIDAFVEAKRKTQAGSFKIAAYIRQTNSPREWIDYLNMIEQLDGYIDYKKAFPDDLAEAHANVVSIFNRRENETKNKETMLKFQHLREYEYKNEAFGLAIVAPIGGGDLLVEGSVLQHCVGSYANRVADGKTAILFVRDIDKIDNPKATMEFQDGEVVQLRGKRNADFMGDQRIMSFVEEWKKCVISNLQETAAA